MNPFDLSNLGGLMGGLQQRMAEMKQKAATTKVTGEAADGNVAVTVTCDYHVDSVFISEDVMDDNEKLEEYIQQAMSEALRQAREETARGMQQMAGGLPIPPGLIPGL